MADFYDILGVDKNATQDDIKKAYRKAAAKWHPDRWGNKSEAERKNAEETFKKINEANDVLSDPDKRTKYDRFGDDWDKVGSGGPDIDISSFFRHGNPFSSMFGGGGSHEPMVEPGKTIRYQIGISINDIFNGLTKEIKYDIETRCRECNGTGGDTKTCPHCGGTGMVTSYHGFMTMQMQTNHPCPHCGGTGKVITKRCNKCNGEGIKHESRTIKVNVRPGIKNGEIITYHGMGYESRDPKGKTGDLLIQVIYQVDSNKYRFNGNDTYEQINVPYYDCIIGCEKTVKLPNGKDRVIKIPPYSKTGTMITLPNQSFNNGNYIFVVNVEMPSSVSKADKELLEKIKKNH